MNVGGPSAIDASRRLELTYGGKTARHPTESSATALLSPGTLLKGRIESIDATGLLTVSTEAGSFKAAANNVLETGQEVWFQVVPAAAGTNPLLAEAGKTNAVLNLLRVLLPGMQALDGAIGEGSGMPQEAARLIRLLADNAVDGTPEPAKLIKTITNLRLSPPPAAEEPSLSQTAAPLCNWRDLESPAAQKLFRLLEAHALVNQQPAAGADYYLFPVFFAEQAGQGQWLFSFEQRAGGEAESSTSLSFYLSMSQLGDIHLKLTSWPNALAGVFSLSTDAAAAHVRQYLPQLTQALKPLADEVTITCRTARVSGLKALKDDLTAKVGVEQFALIDLKA